MRLAVAALLLLAAGPAPAWAQGAPPPIQQPPARLTAGVVSAALSFVAPRSLEPATVRQLALWGLAAPAALDGALLTEAREASVALVRGDQVAYERPLPAGDGPGDWGALVADVLDAAAAVSAPIRAAGPQALLTAFFDEMFNHLDPYSRYVPPGAAVADRARRGGEAGAGIQIARTGRAVVVTDVNADGPGAEAGIVVGDRLLAVDGRPVGEEPVPIILGWIGGLEGTPVRLTLRGRRGSSRSVTVERATTPPETVFASRLPGIVLLRISGFSRDTDERLSHELVRHLDGPARRGVRGLVLDLRGNRGGLLRQAAEATNLLLDDGVIATTAGRSPEAGREWRASEGDLARGLPVVVLIDGRSASAAEIMAAALADQGRAVLVGSATLGKGLVQTVATLPDGGELFVSWSRVLAPDGWPLQGLGVLPQVCTSQGQDATNAQLAVLRAGTPPMAEALARHRAARAPLPGAEALALRNACPAAAAHERDLAAAQYLIAHPAAYAAARLAAP